MSAGQTCLAGIAMHSETTPPSVPHPLVICWYCTQIFLNSLTKKRFFNRQSHEMMRENMALKIIVRNEKPSDIDAISEITSAAFENHPYSHQTEPLIIHTLRAAGALAVSLVAEVEGSVVGHIAFSPVTVSDHSSGWYGAGPVSVLPALQRQGIGKSLIREGLSLLKASGAKGCVLVGDPGYYKRFGFRNLPELTLADVPQEYFLALPFGENRTRGVVVFHEGFSAHG